MRGRRSEVGNVVSLTAHSSHPTLPLLLHHLRKPKTIRRSVLTLGSWRTASPLLALHIFYSLHNFLYWCCPIFMCPLLKLSGPLLRTAQNRDSRLWGLNCGDTNIWHAVNVDENNKN